LLFHRDLLNAITSSISLAEEIENRYEVEKGEELRLSRRLQQLEESLASKPVDLTSFRKLPRKELQGNKELPKPALHALIERITAYLDQKMKGTHGGQDLYPHESQYPVHELSFARVLIAN